MFAGEVTLPMPSQPPKPPRRVPRKLNAESTATPPELSASQVADSKLEDSRKSQIWYAILIAGVILLFLLLLIAGSIGIGVAMKMSSSEKSSSEAQAPRANSASDTEETGQANQPEDDSSRESLPKETSTARDKQLSDMTSNSPKTPSSNTTGTKENLSGNSLGDKDGTSDIDADAPIITISSSGFFGIVAKGRKFVYVVDCSGSMTGLPFTRAKQEVMRSISSLSEDQAYSIILFATESYPMYSPSIINHMEKPTPDALQKTENWLDSFSIKGGTAPQGALLKALQMGPDAIFFLTDGGFEAHVAAVITQANTNNVSINTICFISRTGEPILKQIAKANQGDYRFVP